MLSATVLAHGISREIVHIPSEQKRARRRYSPQSGHKCQALSGKLPPNKGPQKRRYTHCCNLKLTFIYTQLPSTANVSAPTSKSSRWKCRPKFEVQVVFLSTRPPGIIITQPDLLLIVVQKLVLLSGIA